MKNTFLGGVPLQLDVDKLITEIGVPVIGQVVLHSQIEEVLGVARTTNRYKAVLVRWRKQLLDESNVETVSEFGIGIKAITPSERIDEREKDHRAIARKTTKALKKAVKIPASELSQNDLRRHDHVVNVLVSTHAAVEGANRRLQAFKKAMQIATNIEEK